MFSSIKGWPTLARKKIETHVRCIADTLGALYKIELFNVENIFGLKICIQCHRF
jgi:hypothetical protein